jgi:hypothetical protein
VKNGHFVRNYVKRVPTQQMSTRATVSSVTGRLFPALKKENGRPVKNLCEIRTMYLNTATKKSLFH